MRSFVAAGVLWCGVGAAQTGFEVASVKPAVKPGSQGVFCIVPCTAGEQYGVQGARLEVRYFPIRKLIETAYGIKSYQLIGPDWMDTQRFDIVAEIPAGADRKQVPEMLRALMAERFKLTVHRESRELNVLELVVGKGGAKLTASGAAVHETDTSGSKPLYTPQGEARMLANGTDYVLTGGPYGAMHATLMPDRGIRSELYEVTMAGLAEILTPRVEHPVIDRTGLVGTYHFVFQVRPSESFADGILAAVERAGLRLEKGKAAIEVTVVDHVERVATEN